MKLTCSAVDLNLNDLDHDLKKFLDNFQNKNNHTNIIGYYENNFKSFVAYENKLFLLKKPFRLSTLNNHIDNIKMLESFNNVNKFFMKFYSGSYSFNHKFF